MDRKYLENYEQKELSEYKRLVERRIQDGKFFFEKDRFPPDERFVNLQKPVAITTLKTTNVSNLWAQVPFSGSLIISIASLPRYLFEKYISKTSEIPKIIDFIKETGRLQVVLSDPPTQYEGLDYMDPFFKELKPPLYLAAPLSIFGNEKEIEMAANAFFTLGDVRYLDFVRKASQQIVSRSFQLVVERDLTAYIVLKLSHYARPIVEAIENFMIDDPEKAFMLFIICKKFITAPTVDLRSKLTNYTLEEIRTARNLPLVYQPQEIRFPCEIGKFLMKKLTYAPQGLRACNELIDEYDAYDLRKVAESLNDSIVTNHPDVVNKSASELSEILDNIWNDSTIQRRVKGLKIGVPLSMAAIGSVVAGPIGAAGGFLAGLGFDVAHKFIDVETTELSEKLVKLRTKSYQANVYDFKKKYKGKIAHP